jgi:hypothetical protein
MFTNLSKTKNSQVDVMSQVANTIQVTNRGGGLFLIGSEDSGKTTFIGNLLKNHFRNVEVIAFGEKEDFSGNGDFSAIGAEYYSDPKEFELYLKKLLDRGSVPEKSQPTIVIIENPNLLDPEEVGDFLYGRRSRNILPIVTAQFNVKGFHLMKEFTQVSIYFNTKNDISTARTMSECSGLLMSDFDLLKRNEGYVGIKGNWTKVNFADLDNYSCSFKD